MGKHLSARLYQSSQITDKYRVEFCHFLSYHSGEITMGRAACFWHIIWFHNLTGQWHGCNDEKKEKYRTKHTCCYSYYLDKKEMEELLAPDTNKYKVVREETIEVRRKLVPSVINALGDGTPSITSSETEITTMEATSGTIPQPTTLTPIPQKKKGFFRRILKSMPKAATTSSSVTSEKSQGKTASLVQLAQDAAKKKAAC